MTNLNPGIEALAEAIQRVANADPDAPSEALVTQAIVVYEVAGFEPDGEPWRRVAYTVPTENFSLSGAIGLLEAGRYLVRRDGLDPIRGDE